MITIGISPDWDTQKGRINIPNDYITAVLRAGGLPLLFPLLDSEEAWKAMIDKVDGVIFSGGEDIDPKHFGEEVHPDCGTIIPERDAQELFGYKYLLTTGKPFLAICRGIQVMNVAEGGTLYQDIPSQISRDICHNQGAAGTERTHSAAIEPGSYMHSIAKCDTMLVNSFHHQALNTIGDGLKVSARAMDGVVEAVENADGSVFAVQWHPELLYAENPEHRAIFETFVNRCAAK